MKSSLSVSTDRTALFNAFFRISPFSDALDSAVRRLACPKWDIVQFLFKDIPETEVQVGRVSKGKFGRVIQIGVGLPAELSFKPADDPWLVDACAGSIARAIKAMKLTRGLTTALLERVEMARVKARDRSEPDRSLQW